MSSFNMFGDQFLEYVGIDISDFATQPDPFEAVGLGKTEPEEITDDLMEQLGIADEVFSQPDPFLQQTDLSIPSSSNRFVPPMTTSAIEEKRKARIPEKTKQSTRWGKAVWDDWARAQNSLRTVGDVEPGDNYFIIPVDLSETSPEEMGFWLSRFVFEIRRQDGKPYPPKTLYNIVAAIMRHFREDLSRHDMNFLDKSDTRFAEFRKALDARMKELTAQGVGTTKRQADPLTPEDEDTLWATGTVSTKTATGLSNGVFLYNCKIFGLRGMDEHRHLQVEQYAFGVDQTGRYMKFTGRVSKNVQGGLNHRQVDVKSIKQYADNTNPRCVVHLFESYLNALPEKRGSFYRRPLANSNPPRCSLQVVGVNKLKTYMKTMFEKAGINLQGRNISNHSGKVTCATQMWEAGFDEQTIMGRTGHRSNAVRAYKRPSNTLLQDVSNKLQPPKPQHKKPATSTVTTEENTTTTGVQPTINNFNNVPTTVPTILPRASAPRLSIEHPNGLKITMDF
ncbi:PREDICTED: zinc finger MYM-type protein 2-like [Branchiostoma belcheri]|uniref:Zinc finger MYM-type protein 2-like n=1 Tax=Branchiostoma belcheri TaxID=7741 RepID=A0A6P5A226_BRABE|nr:PREDICTED: zinc finger MYM-type protein 2-like [Branchiostoma belcheri]